MKIIITRESVTIDGEAHDISFLFSRDYESGHQRWLEIIKLIFPKSNP